MRVVPDIVLIPRGGRLVLAIELLRFSHCYEQAAFLIPSPLGGGLTVRNRETFSTVSRLIFCAFGTLDKWAPLFNCLYQFGWVIM